MLVAALLGILFVAWGREDSDRSSVVVAAATDDGARVTTTPTDVTTAPPGNATVVTTAKAPLATTTTTTTTAASDPGALPQTDERPTASGATFTAGVDGLWEAIRQDKPELALPFFFPKRAYLQVKAISDPSGDYQNRLIANYEDDIHMLHAQLGANAANAQYVGISVPDDQAVFVQPGEESNKGTYWRVYGTTMQYQVDGQTGSFPVTSMISWRGQWYVVHLGAIR
jgi:hypothetical protein